MAEYIFGVRSNIHIIDSPRRCRMFHRALAGGERHRRQGGRILFVGTKRQAQEAVKERRQAAAPSTTSTRVGSAARSSTGKTVSNSIKRLRALEEMLASGEGQGYTKKERLTLQRERDKLDRSLAASRHGRPARPHLRDRHQQGRHRDQGSATLGLPVAAVVDTNSDPRASPTWCPAIDDASRAIALYCDLVAKAAIDGISRAQGDAGVDTGAAARPTSRILPAEAPVSGFEPLSGRGASPTTQETDRRLAAIEKQLNDLGNFFTIRRSPRSTPPTSTRSGEEVGLPGRVDGWVAQAKAERQASERTRRIFETRRDQNPTGYPIMATISAQMVKELREATGAA